MINDKIYDASIDLTYDDINDSKSETDDYYILIKKYKILEDFSNVRDNGIYIPNIFSVNDELAKLERFHAFYINGKQVLNMNDQLVVNMYNMARYIEYMSPRLTGWVSSVEKKHIGFQICIDQITKNTEYVDNQQYIGPELKLLSTMITSAVSFVYTYLFNKTRDTTNTDDV